MKCSRYFISFNLGIVSTSCRVRFDSKYACLCHNQNKFVPYLQAVPIAHNLFTARYAVALIDSFHFDAIQVYFFHFLLLRTS